MKDRLISACQKVQACAYACFKPAPTYEALCSDIRSSIITTEKLTDTDQAFQYDTTNLALLTDRRYHTNKLDNRKQQQNSETPGNRKRWTKKKCFVCKKEGCWSTNHSRSEQDRAKKYFEQRLQHHNKTYSDKNVQQYILSSKVHPITPMMTIKR